MTDQSLELSVIVPCHNEAATLPTQLDALMAQQWDGAWEIIVVDNNSTDETAEIAAGYSGGHPSVRVVTADGGAGVAYARNAGARASTATSVAFCDGDDMVLAGWTAAIGSALRHHALVSGSVDVHTLNPDWLSESRPVPRGDLPSFGSTPFVRGNNCAMHRSVWERLDGFSENFVGLEDIEFSLRAAGAGIDVVAVPSAIVAYRYRSSMRDAWRQGVFYGRGRTTLARIAADHGLDGPSSLAWLRPTGWLVVNAPRVVTKRGRAAWTWVAANRWGALLGRLGR